MGWHTSHQSKKHLWVHLMAFLGSLKYHAKLWAVNLCSTQWSDKSCRSDCYRIINVVGVFIWHLLIQYSGFQNIVSDVALPIECWVKYNPGCFVSAIPFILVRLFYLCTLCHCFYPACHLLSVWQQLSNLSCLAERVSWGVGRWGTYSFLSFPTSPFFLVYGFTPPSLFPLTPSVLFLICRKLQQHPPLHAFSSLIFRHLSSTNTPHWPLILFSLLPSLS